MVFKTYKEGGVFGVAAVVDGDENGEAGDGDGDAEKGVAETVLGFVGEVGDEEGEGPGGGPGGHGVQLCWWALAS